MPQGFRTNCLSRLIAYYNNIVIDRNTALQCRDSFPYFAQRQSAGPGHSRQALAPVPWKKTAWLGYYCAAAGRLIHGTGDTVVLWNGLKCSFFWTVLLFVSVSCCASCPNNQYIFWGRVSLLYPKIASDLLYRGGWLQSSDPPNLTSWMTALQACTITTRLWGAEKSNGSFVHARETLFLLNYMVRPNSQVFTLLYPLLCSKCPSSSQKSCMHVF